MGCNFSRLEINGATLATGLRPLFLKRREAIKARRLTHCLLKDSTLSKKELLSHDQEDMNSSNNPSNSLHNSPQDIIKKPETTKGSEPSELKIETPRTGVGMSIKFGNRKVVTVENSTINSKNDGKESPMANAKGIKQDASGDNEDDDDDNDDNDIDDRMIGYGDGEAFPGSPSFRIYFKENWEDEINIEIGRDDFLKETSSTADSIPSKEQPSLVDKKVQRESKKRRFRKVLRKRGAVKNLLNMKSCYCLSNDRDRHIITGKPPLS